MDHQPTVLVYLDDEAETPDFDGHVFLATQIDAQSVLLLTDAIGQLIDPTEPVQVTEENILNLREVRFLFLPYFFYFFPLTSGPLDQGEVVGRNFVDKSRTSTPLAGTSRSAMGSGLYGVYLTSKEEIEELLISPQQEVRVIECQRPFFLQDKEHGISLTIASFTTNSWLDEVLEELTAFSTLTEAIIEELIQRREISHLVRLWNFVLRRNELEQIEDSWLQEVLIAYMLRYLSEDRFYDRVTNHPLEVLPINEIMYKLGYQEIVAQDYYNNGWDRGCVSLDFTRATSFQRGVARY